jgi:hypothetical protein
MSVRHALVAKMCNLFVSIILTFTKILWKKWGISNIFGMCTFLIKEIYKTC